MRSPPTFEPSIARSSDSRPILTLPSLPSLTLAASIPRGRNNFGEYALDSSRTGAQTYAQLPTSTFDSPMSTYQPSLLSYGYQQPRGQSYSGPSSYSMSHDRTPFTSNSHHGGFPGSSLPYGLEVSDGGNDNKQRKRRGNLPKETTDKLRAWFVAHLQHPYPTEDEKQDLMKQTGLQMSTSFCLSFRSQTLISIRSNIKLVHQRPSTSTTCNDQQCTSRI
jgi:Homeobox KN domain